MQFETCGIYRRLAGGEASCYSSSYAGTRRAERGVSVRAVVLWADPIR
jgi:hypothetical protein